MHEMGPIMPEIQVKRFLLCVAPPHLPQSREGALHLWIWLMKCIFEEKKRAILEII